MYEIEDGVPIPALGKEVVEPLGKHGNIIAALQVGQSYALPLADYASPASARQVLHNAWSKVRRKHPERRFISRLQGDVVRMWRIQ